MHVYASSQNFSFLNVSSVELTDLTCEEKMMKIALLWATFKRATQEMICDIGSPTFELLRKSLG